MASSAVNNIVKGICFCGDISFEVKNPPATIYQCHCSECRKTTGASANAGFLVAKDTFRWLSGKGNYKTFIKNSGYRVNFCKTCGSPVPNTTSLHKNVMWVPAGLLEGEPELQVAHHIFTDSKASWDEIAGNAQISEELPADIDVLFPSMGSTDSENHE